eukprot:COSAG06_NODE_54828_length_292_cov_1.414508_1_plen_42_part_01
MARGAGASCGLVPSRYRLGRGDQSSTDSELGHPRPTRLIGES